MSNAAHPTRGRYIGGPLDGQPAPRPGRQRWSLFRNDDGSHMPTYRGDRIFGSRGPQPLDHGYTLQDGDGEMLYVHATVWNTYHRDRAANSSN